MDTVKIFFEILSILVFVYWIVILTLVIKVTKKIPVLSRIEPPELKKWPKLSVIITARNEAQTIESAVRSRLEDDYPNAEFILVDDRSNDETSEIVDRIAKGNSRVKAIHLKELPDEWIGKVNALNEGLKLSTGEWILFSDADVHVRPGTMKRVISYAENEKGDHLVLAPKLIGKTFLLNLVYCTFMRGLMIGARAWNVGNPKSKSVIGAGAFNLVRKSALDKTKGFEWLKMEVVDDIGLALMLKEAQAKFLAVNGKDYVWLYFYPTAQAAMMGAERAFFTAFAGFSFLKGLLWIIPMALEILPFWVYIFPLPVFFVIANICSAFLSIIIHLIHDRWLRDYTYPAFFWPIAQAFTIYALIRAGYLGWMRGGIFWRGTFYPTDLLRAGRRFKIFG